MVLVSSSASADGPSNPAFLGVGMNDMGGARGAGPCVINSIETGSGAEAARLRPGDVFATLDGRAIPNCDTLVSLIQTKSPGTFVNLAMRRNESPISIRAELLSRDEVLRRRLVGQPVPSTSLVSVEDSKASDLSDIRQTTIVGWYQTVCASCESVIATVDRWMKNNQNRRNPLSLVVATAGNLNQPKTLSDTIAALKHVQRKLDVPVLVAEPKTYEQFTTKDADRVHFMVIDCRGVVQYVAPVAPNGADTEAVLDELFAATEQTARRIR
jgi:hypothetical protein